MENPNLESDYEVMAESYKTAMETVHRQRKEIDYLKGRQGVEKAHTKAQQAEIERLRGKLQQIRDEAIEAAYSSENNPAYEATPAFDDIAEIARAALAGEGDDG